VRVVVAVNHDFQAGGQLESRADVQNAARDVLAALLERGHQAELMLVDNVAPWRTVEAIAAASPDLVFNLCESLAGENRHEPVLPALLELARLRYTGSGPLALALALRKDLAKQVLEAAHVPTPPAAIIHGKVEHVPRFPLLCKPAAEDASAGMERSSVVKNRRALLREIARLKKSFSGPFLAEQYIPGREIYVSIVAGRPLPMHEIEFNLPEGWPEIVTYRGKWDPASPDYRGTTPVRARLTRAVARRCVAAATLAFRTLGLKNYARIDLRVKAGRPYVIDVNPNCDLSCGAGVAKAASFAGWSHAELIERICKDALA
jgi:D-alanine-D-alanine ligase